jgi:hypothetical protein
MGLSRLLRVNFSHVEAISEDASALSRLLAIVRGERKVFSHRLDPLLPVVNVRSQAAR